MTATRRMWTTKEITLLKQRYPQEGALPLAQALNRSRKAIQSKIKQLGLRRQLPPKHVWTAAEDEALRQIWPEVIRRKRHARQVAEHLGISLHQVRQRAIVLGLSRSWAGPAPWTDEDEEYLCAHAHLGLDELAKRFRARGTPRTKAALSGRLVRLAQRTRGANEAVYSAHGLGQLMGVSGWTVTRWVHQGLLKAQPRTAGLNRQGGPKEYAIQPKDVRAFIVNHTARVASVLSGADPFWLVDLLTEGKA